MSQLAAERFWAKVAKSDGCWLWTGTVGNHGYGVVYEGNGTVLAHRRALELTSGPIPPGMQALHSCDVRRCVRPDHLRVGTPLDNMRDRVERGGWSNGNVRKSACKHGHPFDAANTIRVVRGGRQQRKCRACNRYRPRTKAQTAASGG